MVHIVLGTPAVMASMARKRSSFYRDVADGLFTKPVKNGRAAFWPEPEVAAIQAARIAGKSDDEIRSLVRRLEAQRVEAAA